MLHLYALALLCLLFNFNVKTTIDILRIKQKIVKHQHKMLKDKRIRSNGNRHGLSPMKLLHLARLYNQVILLQDLNLRCSRAIRDILYDINVDSTVAFDSPQEHAQTIQNIPAMQDFEHRLITSYRDLERYYVKDGLPLIGNFKVDLYLQINKLTSSEMKAFLFDQINKIYN